MHAMETCAVARRIVCFGRNRKACLYYAACVVLLVAAAGLRFHDLSEKSLRHDEARTANISRGALSEVISGTRLDSSSPILYPLVLYAVQKVESTPFSVRIVPATAGVLTIAVMLFLLPGLGVARGAAFLAALLSTLSVEVIRHAQDAREYSIDALLAVLLIAGLLWYLRDGRKSLLCVSLFLAPLLQYGLVLFGGAVMGAAIVLPPSVLAAPEGDSYLSRFRNRLKQRVALVWPAACFLAGCAISYAVTLRYQRHNPSFGLDGYLSAYYYQGGFDAHSIFEFSINGIWSLLTYHLPEAVAIAALTAGALLLVAALLGKFQGKFPDRAVAVLFSLCLAISVGAAVLGIYPLGGIRQVIYLGPIVFLAVGVAFHGGVGGLAGLTRRGWPAPALVAAAAVAIALAGVDAMRQDSPYKTPENIKAVLAVLKELVREEDMVYMGWGTVPGIRFYQGKEKRPANYYYGTSGWCVSSPKSCFREMADLAYRFDIVNGRVWIVTYLQPTEFEIAGPDMARILGGSLNNVVPSLYLIEDTESLIDHYASDEVKIMKEILTRKPLIQSVFDIHLHDNALVYAKEPCSRADTEPIFFLHLVPADAADLSEERKQYGFDNLDFGFGERGVIFESKCMAKAPLPKYGISEITTGQFITNEDGSYTHLWKGDIRLDE